MIFFDGKHGSLQGISEILDTFGGWSGLRLNANKTQLFISGQSDEELALMVHHGFQLGELPIRYLGLPLMHRKLKISEYEVLIVKLERRLRSWALKTLSFAGRVQLLNSVINGIITFWVSTFMLPMGCIRRMESLCKRFLWSGDIDSKRGAKVSWKQLCIPKSEGGLGLRDIKTWNTTLLLRFIWLLHSGRDTIWSRWQRENHLRKSNLWTAKISPKNPWTWNELLKLRQVAARFLRCKIGDGTSASFWYDIWTPLGQLIERIGPTGPILCGLPLQSSVREASDGRGWKIPNARSEAMLELHCYLATIRPPLIQGPKDTYSWEVEGNVCKVYTASATWEVLRPRDSKKHWAKRIWFKGHIPKHACTMWFAHLNRLPTRRRLANWGVITDEKCSICSSAPETRDHLLLSCAYARSIWTLINERLRPSLSLIQTWEELMAWTAQGSQESPSTLRRLVSQTAVYNIWRQRNNIIHNYQILRPEVTFSLIDREVKNAIHARKTRRGFRGLLPHWLR